MTTLRATPTGPATLRLDGSSGPLAGWNQVVANNPPILTCTCGQPLKRSAIHCPRCGAKVGTWPLLGKSARRFLIAIVVAAAFAAGLAFTTARDSNESASRAAAQTEMEALKGRLSRENGTIREQLGRETESRKAQEHDLAAATARADRSTREVERLTSAMKEMEDRLSQLTTARAPRTAEDTPIVRPGQLADFWGNLQRQYPGVPVKELWGKVLDDASKAANVDLDDLPITAPEAITVHRLATMIFHERAAAALKARGGK